MAAESDGSAAEGEAARATIVAIERSALRVSCVRKEVVVTIWRGRGAR